MNGKGGTDYPKILLLTNFSKNGWARQAAHENKTTVSLAHFTFFKDAHKRHSGIEGDTSTSRWKSEMLMLQRSNVCAKLLACQTCQGEENSNVYWFLLSKLLGATLLLLKPRWKTLPIEENRKFPQRYRERIFGGALRSGAAQSRWWSTWQSGIELALRM